MGMTLRLRALDELGRAVEGASVHHDDALVATTDADGVATLDGIEPGFELVTVSHPMPAEARVVLSLGEGSSGLVERTVILQRGATLRGTVEAPDGTPLAGAALEVWCADDETLFVESDDAGHWGTPALRAGAYEVRARADGYAPGSAIQGTHDGRTEQRDVVVRVATGARLVGRVRDGGAPVVGARVYAETSPADSRTTETDTEGRFVLVGIAPERHLLHVGHGDWTSSVLMGGDGDEQTLDIDLSAAPAEGERYSVPSGAFAAPASRVARDAHDIDDARHIDDARDTGAVPDIDDAPDADDAGNGRTSTLIGRVMRDGAPVSRFAIVRRGHAEYRWITEPAIIAVADGRFSLAGLRSEACTVHVLAEGTAWASSSSIRLEPGSTHDLGDVELQPGLRVAGSVCDEAGVPLDGAHVEVGGPAFHDDALQEAAVGRFATTSAQDGSFVFDGIHVHDPRVRIAAWHPIHGASTHYLLADRVDPIRLVLVPTGALEGLVVPSPAAASNVIVRADVDEGGCYVARVRPSGRFVVERLLPGVYTVELVQRPRWPRRIARVTVIAGQRVRVHVPPP